MNYFKRIYLYEKYKQMTYQALMAKINAKFIGENLYPYEVAFRYARLMKYKFSKK